MCGINGIIKLDGTQVDPVEIVSMNNLIKHRGPDDSGFFVKSNVGFGHVRLAILDLSSRGHQPMRYTHEKREVTITYNGEIYNFRELRAELVRKGYAFSSETDTEVILASYLEYGVECLKKFNGMFAFALFDPSKQIIFFARDRFGEKPFKYYWNSNLFVFSSELKAILTNPITRNLDYEAISDFLTLQYVPAPNTGFQNIKKLPHGHYGIFDLKNKTLDVRQYYNLEYNPKLPYSEADWIEIVSKELEKAVRRRLVADVPVGAFLSGGLDSSLIVAFMTKLLGKVKTFSIAFEEREWDESPYANEVAKLFQTDHTVYTISASDMLSHIEDLILHFEEPFADNAQLGNYILSKLTREQVKVVLSGDGGDENFGGYPKHQVHAFNQQYEKWLLPGELLVPLFRLAQKFWWNGMLHHGYVYLQTLKDDVGRRHYNYTSFFDEWSKSKFYRKDFEEIVSRNGVIFSRLVQDCKAEGVDRVLWLDFNSYLPDDINVKVDMASMKNGLEVRAPMLDYEFVETVARMPWVYKTDAKEGKKILKQIGLNYLPRHLVYRKKQGFGLPIKQWIRTDLKEHVREVILCHSGVVKKLMKGPLIEKLLTEHWKGRDHSTKIWALFVLNSWHRKYFSA